MPTIIPAILTDNLETFAKQIRLIENLTDIVHIDICDGLFVPTKTLEAEVIQTISTTLKYELHLMVSRPSAEIDRWSQAANINRIIFHLETTPLPPLIIDQIEEGGRQAGLTFNPDTPLSAVEPYFSQVKYIMVMGVTPGRQGQAFVPATVTRVKEIKTRWPELTVAADGGVHLEQLEQLKSAGADCLIMGSEIFTHNDPRAHLVELNKLLV